MEAIRSILTMYLFTVPMAVLAFRYGLRMLRLREPPAGTMRTLQLGRPVTDPVEKLALAHQIGWVWIIFGLAMVVGPLLTALSDSPESLVDVASPTTVSRHDADHFFKPVWAASW